MKKTFTKQSRIRAAIMLLAALFAVNVSFAETGTETNPGSNPEKDVDIVGTCYTIPATHNPSGMGKYTVGNMTSGGVKLRTNSDGNRIVFLVNENYTLNKLELEGTANTEKAEDAETNIKVIKVEVDGVEVSYTGGEEFPYANTATTSCNLTISDINAKESIAIYFDNSGAASNKQIFATWAIDWTYGETAEEPEAGEGAAAVKMTYVDYDNADTAMGEVEVARAGYNKISGGEVGFVNTGWGENKIAYLQVDASEYPGTITNATLTFDASGSTDSKRTTGWGVGYNSSEWSADMTYNTADKSITTIGGEQWTTTKSATVFESFTFDITEALKNAEGKVATILVYETAAAGGYLKNPAVTVSYTTAKPYAVTFTETNGVEATVTVNGSDVTNGTELPDGTYEFTATAAGYKDYAGEFTVAGADLEVEFTMEAKAIYSYTVKGVDAEGNDLGTVNEGEGYEGESVTYYYPEFVLDGTTLYKKNNNSSNPYWGATGLLDTDEKEFTVTYGDATITEVVFYKEAEEIEGFTAKTTNNAPIRCSNGVGGIVEGEVLLTTLPAGKYQIFGQVWGTTGLTAGVKAGADGENVWTLASTGSLANVLSDEFELAESTDLYVYTEGGNDNHMLDLIYIVRTGVTTGIDTINAKAENGEVYNLQGQKVEKAQKGVYIVNGKKTVIK